MEKKTIKLTESQLMEIVDKVIEEQIKAGRNLRKRARGTNPEMNNLELSQNIKRTNAGKIIKMVKDALIGAGVGVATATAISKTMRPEDLGNLDVAQSLSGLMGAGMGVGVGDALKKPMSQEKQMKRGQRLRNRLGYDKTHAYNPTPSYMRQNNEPNLAGINEEKNKKKKILKLTESQLINFIEKTVNKILSEDEKEPKTIVRNKNNPNAVKPGEIGTVTKTANKMSKREVKKSQQARNPKPPKNTSFGIDKRKPGETHGEYFKRTSPYQKEQRKNK